MRASQKNRMSYPLMSNVVGEKARRSEVSPGQPSVESGHRPELNHVSSTSGSCSSFSPPHFEHFSGGLAGTAWPSTIATRESRAGIIPPQGPCQIGIRWPHPSSREMHQSPTLASQSIHTLGSDLP